jgi:hypothetical protein
MLFVLLSLWKTKICFGNSISLTLLLPRNWFPIPIAIGTGLKGNPVKFRSYPRSCKEAPNPEEGIWKILNSSPLSTNVGWEGF